ncbi:MULTISPECIES: universal stress protein [Alcaligenaceae]|nr:universal stress protein [Bordetella genomosp. 10]
MYRKILVALDGSDVAQAALEHALHLGSTENAEVVPVYVVEYSSAYYSAAIYDVTPFHDAMMEEANKVVAMANERLTAAGVRGKARFIDKEGITQTIAQQLQDAAEEEGADLVVLGTHGRRGFQRMVLGSVAEAFLRLSTRPVLLVPAKAGA